MLTVLNGDMKQRRLERDGPWACFNSVTYIARKYRKTSLLDETTWVMMYELVVVVVAVEG